MADELSSDDSPNQRRRFLQYFASIGLSSSLLPGVLWAKLHELKAQKITLEMLLDAEEISGLHFTDVQREMMLDGVNQNRDMYRELRQVHLDVSVPPAYRFSPILPGMRFDTVRRPFRMSEIDSLKKPSHLESLSFWPVTHLSVLLRSRQLSSQELTELYVDRLKRFDAVLKCVVTLTDDLALKQAKQADAEIKAGRYRGPLHGIPWGAKDLIAKSGYPTTWGAPPFKRQIIPTDATVVERLDKAGAVLVAKLATGELAHDDIWFGGQTRNPWDTTEGSGGSSAGPGSATAAGLVGFAIGTETGGSIVDPAIRCGVTALRPTFGRVSRNGIMPGAWSFDKVGPMCRSVEDCAVVLNAIHGPDGIDLTVVDLPFNWNVNQDIRRLRVGYLKTAFEQQRPVHEEQVNDEATLEVLSSIGVKLREMDLPNLPINATNLATAFAEISAVWDEMVRNGEDTQLIRQDPDHIGNLCRKTQIMPAIAYIQANRIRTLLMKAMADIMSDFDIYIAPQSRIDEPSSIHLNLWLTNLTGHPAVVVPNGFARGGKPTGISFIGNLYDEGKLLALAKAYQDATEFHRKHPPAFGGRT
jgi:Asp-tRNA(Asn)/Glu-tRNA(Gln) amidotransferase A subunit family amidase